MDGEKERANIRFFNSMSKFLLFKFKRKLFKLLKINTKQFLKQKFLFFYTFFLVNSEKCRNFAGAKTEVP